MIDTRFEPKTRLGRRHNDPAPGAKQAAVLILLYPHRGQWHLPLTLRPDTLPDHASQVCLPGGATETGETAQETALREFSEELCVDEVDMHVLGPLSPIYVNVSNFLVEPFLAVAESRPKMTPNPVEVDELLEVPLVHLVDPANFGNHQLEHAGQFYEVPHFQWQSHRIWGATCMILGEMVALVEGLGSID
jgi:8-oxo-dGTP pyrophosphatase MutT (NUDIX family)